MANAKERVAKYRKRHEVKKSLEKYKGIENKDYVTCKICGKRSLYIDKRHLKTRHDLTKLEYIKQFPNAILISERKKIAQSRSNNPGNTGRRFSGEHKLKIALSKFGDKNPSWCGGVSRKGYCDVWKDNEYKQSIKDRDLHKCQNPYCIIKSNDLVIHHINYRKHNCHPWNLITLCRSCNSKANHNRKYWLELYSNL
jgi:hypothetical protein